MLRSIKWNTPGFSDYELFRHHTPGDMHCFFHAVAFAIYKKTSEPNPKWPVTETDEKAVWLHFKNMVTLACRYVNENKSKYPEVNIDLFVNKYGVKL